MAQGPESTEREARQRALAAQLAVRGALREVSDSTRRISGELARLKGRGPGLASGNGVFLRYADYGATQLRWMDAQLAAATRLANAASEVEDPDMQLALLRVAGPRLEAAMMGSLLLAVWLDFLHLSDVALKQRFYSVETLFTDMWRWQEMLEPAMTALSSREYAQVEAAARDVPSLVGHLTKEFAATVERMHVAAENLQKVLLLKEALETVTLLLTMRLSLPSAPPSTPALVGIRSDVVVRAPEGTDVTWERLERVYLHWEGEPDIDTRPWRERVHVEEELGHGGWRGYVTVSAAEATPELKQILDSLHGRDAAGKEVVVSWSPFKREPSAQPPRAPTSPVKSYEH